MGEDLLVEDGDEGVRREESGGEKIARCRNEVDGPIQPT